MLNAKIDNLMKITENSKVKRAEMASIIMNSKSTAKEIEKSINYTIDVEDIQMKETVFETNDEVMITEAIQCLIRDYVDYSDDTSYDFKMFSDPEFKPNQSSLYLENDLSKSDKQEFIEDDLYKIEWFRPKDIAEDECGFTALSRQKRDDMRIIQGNLKDNWFLSALSIIRTEDTLFQNLTWNKQFDRYRTYGLYVFKFFKDGSSFYVIIDDKIPCIEK